MPTKTTRPPRRLVREYLERRTYAPTEPPPSPAEIREMLDWHVVPDSDAQDQQ